MADLVRGIPQSGDPEYLRYSHPISEPESNKAGLYLGKGLGEAIEQGTSEADKTIATYAENKAYQLGDEAKRQEEQNLSQIEAQFGINASSETKASSQTQPLAYDGSQSLIQKNQDLPPEIRFGTRTASSLAERYGNGKISQTDYKSSVDTIAKDLNSQFPAYRKQIAQGLERATGVAGADAAIQSRIQNLNQIIGQINEQKNKVDSRFMESLKDMPDNVRSQLLHRRFDLSPNDPKYLGDTEALYHTGKYEAIDVNQNRALRSYELKDKKRTATQEDFKDMVSGFVTDSVARFGHNFVVSQGVDTFDQILEKLRDPNLPDSEKLKLATSFQDNLDDFKARVQKDAAPLVRGKGSTGYGEVNKQINDATAFLEEQAKRMRDPANVTAAVFASKNFLDSQNRDLNYTISQQPMARKMQIAKALDDTNPELAGKVNSNILANEKDFNAQVKGMYENVVRSVLGVPRDDKNPPIIKDYQDAAERAGMAPKNQMKFMNFVHMMEEKTMPDEKAYRIGKAFFDPKNQGMVGKWQMDQYDPSTGKTTQGQISVLRNLASEGVANRVKELSKTHPDLFTDYTNFIQNTVKREVWPTLMDDVKNLTAGPDHQLSYNTETQHFDLKPIKPDMSTSAGRVMAGKVVQQAQAPYNRFLESTKNKINFVFDALKNVAKISGEKDANVYILRQLLAERPDMFSREVPGLPGEINKAIQNQMLAREMEKQQEAERKKKDIEKSQ